MTQPTDFLDTLDVTNVREHPEPEPKAKPDSTPDAEDVDAEEAEHDEEQDEPEEEAETPPAKGAKAEKPAATAAASESEKAAGFKAGMLAERKKRQELEARLKALEAKQQQPEQPAKPAVKFREDPERFVIEAVSSVEARHMNALEADMREQHEDFDEVAALVVKAAELDPALRQKVFEAGNPARAMYKLGKQLQEAEKLRDPEAYKASLRDELLAELRQELGLKDEAEAPKAKPSLPRDLSNGRSGTDQVATTQPVDPRRGDFGNLFDYRQPPS